VQQLLEHIRRTKPKTAAPSVESLGEAQSPSGLVDASDGPQPVNPKAKTHPKRMTTRQMQTINHQETHTGSKMECKDCGYPHNLTHRPKRNDCEICNEGRIQNKVHRKKTTEAPDDTPKPEKFGDQLTTDHIVVGKLNAGKKRRNGSRIILDRWSNWTDAFPAATKNAEDTQAGLQKIIGPYHKPDICPKSVYTDGSQPH